ncbi:MAG: leucyl/phenylalanyl-tRNA--protein transferase [Planctomycetes bacterium]|nr:leucyl/phenylalanyl-tRNA--protein transferase [Planctomycetota bacterium]NOG52929.1 leucyl/phenylalanyl-tRNA--protein transferase [Planctomycetota bacterium]
MTHPPPKPDRSANPLEPHNLLRAYSLGAFMMADPDTGSHNFYCCDPRAVLPFHAFHCPRSLRKLIRRKHFQIRSNTAFSQVMRHCSRPRRADDQPWISPQMIAAYSTLHDLGFAHSIEAYLGDTLVGGIYGVSIHAAFFAESMFCLPQRGGSNASKVCLAALVSHLRNRHYLLLDVQLANPHTEQFGVVNISHADFTQQLQNALAATNVCWYPFPSDEPRP